MSSQLFPALVNIMPFSFYRKLQLQDLEPTDLVIQLVGRSIKRPVGILEDVPVQVDKFIIPYDFIVIDMDENFQAPLILGRPFLATAGVVIDVQAGAMSFQLCGERVDFCFPQPASSPLTATPSPPKAPVHIVLPNAAPGIAVVDAMEDPICGLPFCMMFLRQPQPILGSFLPTLGR